jgi:murein hydrolase activator
VKKGWILAGCLALGGAAVAQTIGDERRALDRSRFEAAAARARSARLDAQAETARDEAERARVAQAAVAARIQAAEADLAAAAAQLAIARRLGRAQEARLAAKQQPIVRLTAALQTMARRPAAAVLAQPGTLSDLVHVRAVLNTAIPRINAETAGLRAELSRARALRAAAASALDAQRQAQAKRREEQAALARLEILERRRAAQLAGSAGLEAERAVALAEQTRDLEELVAALGRQSALRDALMALPGPVPRPLRPGEAPPAESDVAATGLGSYRLPVIGNVVRGFGDVSRTGIRSRGVTVRPAPGAVAVAPAKGLVTFAGPYRGYGQIVIVDHGAGWTTLITGLAAISARVGDPVDPGSPVGRAADAVTVELRRNGTPVDLARMIG